MSLSRDRTEPERAGRGTCHGILHRISTIEAFTETNGHLIVLSQTTLSSKNSQLVIQNHSKLNAKRIQFSRRGRHKKVSSVGHHVLASSN
jgi:hypothetical protein